MITPAKTMPAVTEADFFYLKICCAFADSPENIWVQDDNAAFLQMANGTLILADRDGNSDELTDFLRFLSPKRVFATPKTLEKLGLSVSREFVLLSRKAEENPVVFLSHEQNSREIYDLLSVEGLELPDYEDFAVDFCRNLNRGSLHYFALPRKCVALSKHSGDFAEIIGIASHEKGYGTVALDGILQKNKNRTVLVCCRPDVRGFYEKNGFTVIGKAGYWENG